MQNILKPYRVKLSRTKGWRMPENTLKVDRTTRWGNPFPSKTPAERQNAVIAYNAYIQEPAQRKLRQDIKSQLQGRNLACWCPLSGPCHADILLEIANS